MMEIQDLVWDRHNEVVGFNNGPLHALMNKKIFHMLMFNPLPSTYGQ